MPNSLATRSPDSRLRLATLTNSTPGMALKPGICRSRVFLPAPTMPMRTVSSLILMLTKIDDDYVSRWRVLSSGRPVVVKENGTSPYTVGELSFYKAHTFLTSIRTKEVEVSAVNEDLMFQKSEYAGTPENRS